MGGGGGGGERPWPEHRCRFPLTPGHRQARGGFGAGPEPLPAGAGTHARAADVWGFFADMIDPTGTLKTRGDRIGRGARLQFFRSPKRWFRAASCNAKHLFW
jgi:hypothetical protein